MSIATQLTALNTDKSAIAGAITAKGGTVSQNAGFDTFATDIASIDIYRSLKQKVSGQLTAVTAEMLNGVTALANYAFFGVPIQTVVLPNSLLTIGTNTFAYCPLTSIVIPDSVTAVGRSAFNWCALTTVTIGSGITEIGNSAFADCISLASVTVKATNPPALKNVNAFSNTHNNLTIYVPAASVNDYKAAANWSNYASQIQAIVE